MKRNARTFLILFSLWLFANPVTIGVLLLMIDESSEVATGISDFFVRASTIRAYAVVHAASLFVSCGFLCQSRLAIRVTHWLLGLWLIVFFAIYTVGAAWVTGPAWGKMAPLGATVLKEIDLAIILTIVYLAGGAVSLRIFERSPQNSTSHGMNSAGRLRQQLVKIFVVILSVALVAIYWVGNRYDRALRHYQSGRYVEAIALIESFARVVDWPAEVIRVDSVPEVIRVDPPPEWREGFVLLAQMYEFGQGTEVDQERALKLYRSAIDIADNGVPRSRSLFVRHPETNHKEYVGYERAPQAALGACRLTGTFPDAVKYCKGFEYPINTEALNDTESAQFAVKKYRSFFNVPDPDVRLLRAAVTGDINVVRKAIQLGANVNSEFPDPQVSDPHIFLPDWDASLSNDPSSPLWAAAVRYHAETVALPLANGADPNLKPSANERSLLARIVGNAHTIIWMNDKLTDDVSSQVGEILTLLLDHGYEVTERDLSSINWRQSPTDQTSVEYNARMQIFAEHCLRIIDGLEESKEPTASGSSER